MHLDVEAAVAGDEEIDVVQLQLAGNGSMCSFIC